MDLATGAMGSLLPKLAELLHEEYKLQTGVKKDVESLAMELTSIQAALSKVGAVPRDELDKQVRLWADNVRELSYEMEDVVDSFMVRVEGDEPDADMKRSKRFRKKIANFFKKGKTRHQIADKIQEIKVRVKQVADLRDRYQVDHAGANSAAPASIDPRILSLFKDQRELVGIEEPRDVLIKRLADGDDGASKQELKLLSIFGFGGLGKTTLAKAVYDKLPGEFDHRAFVSVGQSPDLKKVLMEILRQLDHGSYMSATMLDVDQLIGELRRLLQKKRYLIVVDDIWDTKSWEIIRCSLIESKCRSVIITTTRILEVAKESGHVYKHKPLSQNNSRELFYKRLSIGKVGSYFDQTVEISEKILQKCSGVPLAIITIASLLAGKPREDWSEVYNSIGFGHEDNIHVDNTRKILLFSYYDLPCYLRTCLLHLSIFPEDHEIEKKSLIWKWVAEGFIHEKQGIGLFELGDRYFNELINRSMIQPVADGNMKNIYACRVHDLVLDMIHSLSRDENFVVVLGNDQQHMRPPSNSRRLAIQNRVIDQHDPMVKTPVPQVRSFNVTMCRLGMVPWLSSFQGLRVLAIERCTFIEDCPYHLEHLEMLLQLRYLELSGECVKNLPGEVGGLRFLQTLNLEKSAIKELPRCVGQLRQLKCLRLADGFVGELDWIGNLTSLEELLLRDVSPDFVKELSKLPELREFISSFTESDSEFFKDVMEPLGNLQKLQTIQFDLYRCLSIDWASCESYVPPRHLRRLCLAGIDFPRLPAWIDPSYLPNLCQLEMEVITVMAHDVEILGRFPELLALDLTTDGGAFPDVVGGGPGGAFPKLRYFSATGMLRFLLGPMPNLLCVHYFIGCQACKAANLDGDLATSLGNLPCLEEVNVHISGLASDMDRKKARVAVTNAVDIHPNRPMLRLGNYYHRSPEESDQRGHKQKCAV